MHAHLSTLTFDPAGAVALVCVPSTNTGDVRRRMSRIATLDGSATLNDFGFSEADRTIELEWPITSQAREAKVARLVRLYSRLLLCTAEGVWIVAPEVYRPGAKSARLRLLCIEKITED